jgi:flagellar biosynthesis protein FlhF
VNTEPECFLATSTQEVVAQIRSKLGPDAVVLNVRPITPTGLARFWRKPMIEVMACRPKPAPQPVEEEGGELVELRRRMARLERQLEARPEASERPPNAVFPLAQLPERRSEPKSELLDDDCGSKWRIEPLLQEFGLLASHAQLVTNKLREEHGETPPAELSRQMELAQDFLKQAWRPAPTHSEPSLHVFVGAPGSGKTTCICKWLSRVALVEGRMAHAWRLDGATANVAQNLSVYCEVLGVPIERFWERSARADEGFGAGTEDEIGLIDLPGVDWRDGVAVKQLALQLKSFGRCHVHLAVNAAYESSVLLTQIKAFSALPVTDLVVTHLDEETRWGKLWNLVLGTNYSIKYLSAGQNIPGEFVKANPEAIAAGQSI